MTGEVTSSIISSTRNNSGAYFENLLLQQKTFFRTGSTIDVAYRIKHLKALKKTISARQDEICEALNKDLKKSKPEAYITEVGIVMNELDKTIKNISKWARPRKVSTPLSFKPASSQIRPEPYGNTLIIGPWNFPFSLLMLPMIGALGAGNTVFCKPSEHAPHTAKICKEIIESTFESEYVACEEGGIPETTEILALRWDYIFFTGSPMVGKIVYKAAANHLTPVTLELGGKSPCIIDKTANLDSAANRIISGKCLNAGQVCIAPDYLLIEESIKEVLIEKLIDRIEKFFGKDAQQSEDYGRIINDRNFERLVSLINQDKVIYGGRTDKADRYIEPTLLDHVNMDDKIMQEEIFGPLLPVMTWKNLDEVKQIVNNQEKPLVLYMFSTNKSNVEDILKHCSSGGVTVNDCLLQYANKHLPFGGVGTSGIGSYNGQYSFDTFSHLKGEVHKMASIDPAIRYPPLKDKFKILKWVSDNLM